MLYLNRVILLILFVKLRLNYLLYHLLFTLVMRLFVNCWTMTTKDFLRKRDFYLPFVEYLVRDFPDAPLFDVIVYMEDGSTRHFYTFSQCPLITDYKSLFISKVTKGVFDAFKTRFMSFLIQCSKHQRNSLVQYYSSELHYDEYSTTACAFNLLLNYLESKLPINES